MISKKEENKEDFLPDFLHVPLVFSLVLLVL
jgi:hypothetical protein